MREEHFFAVVFMASGTWVGNNLHPHAEISVTDILVASVLWLVSMALIDKAFRLIHKKWKRSHETNL